MTPINLAFIHQKLGRIRAVRVNDDVYFYGDDICNCLGFKNAETAIAENVERENQTIFEIIGDDYSKKQDIPIINRYGVDDLIDSKDSATSQRIRNWFKYRIDPAIEFVVDNLFELDLNCEVNLKYRD